MPQNDKINYVLRRVRRTKPLYLATAFVASGAVSVYALRQNNLTMVKHKQALFDADEKGEDVQKPLQDLQSYVLNHMNTSLATESVYPPVQLKGTYDRLMAAEKARVDSANSGIYIEAQNFCESQNSTSVSGRHRVACVEQYVEDKGIAEVKAVPASLYQFDFVAPKWSPDFAGWSVVITVLVGAVLCSRLLLGWWYKKRTK